MFQIFTISLLSIIVGLLGLRIAMQVTHYLTKRPVTFNRLFAGLQQKLWMTACLGIFFACLYLTVVSLAAWMLEGDMRQTLFNIVYRHPTYFIYGGLGLFSSISLGILVVRSIIKKVYNSRK